MNQQVFAFDSGTNESLYKIFSVMLACPDNIEDKETAEKKKQIYNACKATFDRKFPINIFFNEYYLFYQIFKESKVQLFNISQLESLIDANAQDILNTPFIDIGDVSKISNGNLVSDEEKIVGFTQEVCKKVQRLSNNLVIEEEFESACNIYLASYKSALMGHIANSMSMIMQSTGYDEMMKRGGRKHWQGLEDAQAYYIKHIGVIKALDEKNALTSIIIDNNWVERQSEVDKNPQLDGGETILDFGITRMDSVAKGMRRTNLVEILGKPKGGKTTFTTYLVERALAKGLNVAVWPLEGTPSEWMAGIQSLTVKHSDNGEGPVINKKDILWHNFKTPEDRKLVSAARAILASPERGKLSFIQGTAYVEDFIDVIKNHYTNENKFDVIVVDSPLLVLSRYGMGKAERIGEALVRLKSFVANEIPGGVLGLVTAQLKQESVDEIRKDTNAEMSVTSGGESAETIRTPDEVIGIYSTPTGLANHQTKFYNVASRHHESFETFFCGCNFSCNDFFDNEELNQ